MLRGRKIRIGRQQRQRLRQKCTVSEWKEKPWGLWDSVHVGCGGKARKEKVCLGPGRVWGRTDLGDKVELSHVNTCLGLVRKILLTLCGKQSYNVREYKDIEISNDSP